MLLMFPYLQLPADSINSQLGIDVKSAKYIAFKKMLNMDTKILSVIAVVTQKEFLCFNGPVILYKLLSKGEL